ncbi:hypothetical protein OF83DRAFT_1201648 [Amylostereum chailletii]|nr:hypothetical protein OF83DRAFT_1201648 [Amylostereum chailletii]
MTSFMDKYGRLALDVASAGTSFGFAAAKAGTRLGFGITRGIASSAAGLTGHALDIPFGGRLGTGQAFESFISSTITYIEQLALLPILLGESLTSASLVAASSSINAFAAFFPGTDEASFSLASFITLVRREWANPAQGEELPEERFGVTEVAQALVAWGALQGVTHDWQVRKWTEHLREIPFHDDAGAGERTRTESRVSITSDLILAHNRGQLLTADITDLDPPPSFRSKSKFKSKPPAMKPLRASNRELKRTLRRLSKMVLAGYGGASLLFFGVHPTSAPAAAALSAEKATLEAAIDASETQAASASSAGPASAPPTPAYSWWDLVMGRHDRDIFLRSANVHANADAPVSAVVGAESRMPRFWVLTDHARREIVLVFRGTMSINELAVDLTCEPEEFEPASVDDEEADVVLEDEDEEQAQMPGALPFPTMGSTRSTTRTTRMRTPSFASLSTFAPSPRYQVHGGMLRMANVMGGKGKPVHVAVREALKKNKGFELVMCGHSLGSGVAVLLAMMWADPKTCLTVRSSGLPVGRRVSVYCFGPPCLTDARLGALASNLVTSFVYSHDVVSRLSLGSIRDMNRAAAWLCKAHGERERGQEGYAGVTKRALKFNTGFGTAEDPVWFLAIRKTLEANMHMTHLYPPGRVLWAVRRGDSSVAPPMPQGERKYTYDPGEGRAKEESEDALRLFEVLDVEKVFSQIVFARDMLSAHLPHQYDRVLEELL